MMADSKEERKAIGMAALAVVDDDLCLVDFSAHSALVEGTC